MSDDAFDEITDDAGRTQEPDVEGHLDDIGDDIGDDATRSDDAAPDVEGHLDDITDEITDDIT
jgi:hypothetical protein